MDILDYLHLVTSPLLSLPLLSLLPKPPSPPAELPGIRPITVRIVTPRRSFILLALSLLAFTSALDAAILIADIATASSRSESPGGLPLVANAVYAFGGFCIWGLTAIITEWRAKWGDRGVLVLGSLGLVCEIPNLVFSVLREIHTDADRKIFTILSIPPLALRILLLPLLLFVVSTPIIRYERASESTGLLSEQDERSAGQAGRLAPEYGTFNANGNAQSGKASSSRVSSQAGTATPTPNQQGPVIPKVLGTVKKEDKPLTWQEIWVRLKKLSPHLWPSTSRKLQFYVILCMFFILVIRFANPLTPIALGEVVRTLTLAQQGHPTSPWFPFAGWIGLRYMLGGNGLLNFANNVLWVPVAQYTDREMQLLCFNHLLNLSLAYHTKRNTGEVLKIIDRGSAINNLFQTVLFTAIPTVFDIFIAFGVFMYLYGPLLACITLAIMAAYIVFSITHTNWRMTLRRVMVEKDIKQRGIVSDVLTNWESVKYFTAEDRETRRFRESILSYQETEAKVSIGFNFLSLIQFFLLTLGLTLGSFIVAFRILHGQADAAQFVVFIQYYVQMQGPLDRFGWLYRILNQETTDAEKMFNLLSQATEVNDKPGAKDLVVTDGVIEFDNVKFSYDGKVDALRGVSFKIGKGQSMALVGESGSGKSTILRLIYRFYDIDSGTIRIDGQDIANVTQLSLRRAIGIVPQDSVLWNDTIGANISYGREGANDEEIIQAAVAARLHERIMGFPEQYTTVVGERGVRLSGGEKQRVSLARMFLKSPAILVLDEATSALDTETEREIQRALADLARGRSSLSIAHRLSTIINSDQIVVMKDGQVVEQGAYAELLEKNGAFATMWKKQIHTEAEMVAQAEGVVLDEKGEKALIELEDESEAGPSRRKSDEPDIVKEETSGTDVRSPMPDAATQQGSAKVAETAGYMRDTSKDAAVIPGVSYAEAVKDDQKLVATHAALEHNDSPPEEESALPSGAQSFHTPADTEGQVGDGLPSNPFDDPSITHSPSDPTVDVAMNNAAAPSISDTPATPSPAETPVKASADADKSATSISTGPSPSRSAFGNKAPFPAMPRMVSSSSQRSDLSTQNDTPSRGSPYQSNNPSSTSVSESGVKEDKRKKRLSGIKGFVRRISDQGMSRSNSLKRLGSDSPTAQTPADEQDEATAFIARNAVGSSGTPVSTEDKRKKRLSLIRGKSDK